MHYVITNITAKLQNKPRKPPKEATTIRLRSGQKVWANRRNRWRPSRAFLQTLPLQESRSKDLEPVWAASFRLLFSSFFLLLPLLPPAFFFLICLLCPPAKKILWFLRWQGTDSLGGSPETVFSLLSKQYSAPPSHQSPLLFLSFLHSFNLLIRSTSNMGFGAHPIARIKFTSVKPSPSQDSRLLPSSSIVASQSQNINTKIMVIQISAAVQRAKHRSPSRPACN